MATITTMVSVPEEKYQEMIDTLASAFAYQPTTTDKDGNEVTNPQSKSDFIQEKSNEHMKEWFKNTFRTEKDRQIQMQNNSNHSIDFI